MYEILPEYIKPYFDIENVENINIDDIIREINTNFSKYFHVDKIKYVLTENKHSSNHKGLSYHYIITNYCVNMEELRLFVKYALNEFNDYIDNLVYTKNRLFRCVNSYGLTKGGKKDMESVHRIIKCSKSQKPISDSVISFVLDLKKIELDAKELFNNSNYKNEIIKEQYYKTNYAILCNSFKESIPKARKCGTMNFSKNTIKKVLEQVNLQNYIYPKKEEEEDEKEEDIYDKIIILYELEQVPIKKNKLMNLKDYYEEHKTFNGVGLSIKAIKYLIKLIEKSL